MTKIKAFSLIELLTVVAIISILATLGISSYTSAVKKGRDAKQKSDIHNIQQALLLYRADMGNYPANLNLLVTNNYLKVVPTNSINSSDPYKYTPATPAPHKTFTVCTGVLESPRNSANSAANTALTNCANNNGDNHAGSCRYYCVTNP